MRENNCFFERWLCKTGKEIGRKFLLAKFYYGFVERDFSHSGPSYTRSKFEKWFERTYEMLKIKYELWEILPDENAIERRALYYYDVAFRFQLCCTFIGALFYVRLFPLAFHMHSYVSRVGRVATMCWSLPMWRKVATKSKLSQNNRNQSPLADIIWLFCYDFDSIGHYFSKGHICITFTFWIINDP